LEAGRGEDALPELRRAVELMPHAPTTERTQVLATEAQVLMLCHHFASAEARCEDALALARTLGARDIEANLLNTVAASFTYAGHPERGAEAAMQALAIARELGLVREIGRAYVNGSDALDHAGRVQAAIALAREGVEACGELGVDRFFGDCLRGEIAGRLVRSAQWDAAAELLDELLERTPTGISAGNGYGHRAVLHAVRGDVERMEEAVRRGERHVDRSGGSMWLAPLAEARATSELWEGRPEDAAATIDAFLIAVAGAESIVSTIRIYELGVRAASDLALRAVGEARAAEAARARIERLLDRADGLAALLSGSAPIRVRAGRRAAAAEAARTGDSGPAAWGHAAVLWDQAAVLWARCDDGYQVAYARWRRAEALLTAGGDRRAAQESARQAYATALAVRARPLARAIEGLARRGRLDLGAGREPSADSADSAARDGAARTPCARRWPAWS